MPESIEGLERYRIESAFEGGQSTVYKAFDTVLERSVALRTPNEATRSDPARLDRFLESARALASIRDEHVLMVHDIRVEEPCFLAAEWMDVTLEAILAEQRLAIDSAISVIEKILSGLNAIHSAGLLHRDLKPANIYLSFDGEDVKVGDLGGAEGTIGDSARFAAPEVLAAEGNFDARSDLYSVGLIAYELLLGRETFEAQFPEIYGAAEEMLRNQRWVNWHQDASRVARPLCEVDPTIPAGVSEVVQRLLAKDAAARFPDADSALRALREAAGLALARPVAAAAPAGDAKRAVESRRRILGLAPPWSYVAIGGVVLLALVAVLVMNAMSTARAKRDAIEAGKAMLQAKEAANAAGANRDPLVAAYADGLEQQRAGSVAHQERSYEEAAKRFRQSERLYRESIPQAQKRAAEVARERMRAAWAAVERARIDRDDKDVKSGLASEASGEESFGEEAFADAEVSFTKAATAFEKAVSGASERRGWPSGSEPAVFQLGSTDAEQLDALATCRQHSDHCDPSWYDSEDLHEVVLSPFTIDSTEVTNAAFEEFVKRTGYQTDAEQGRAKTYLFDGEKNVRVRGYTWREPAGAGSSYQTLPEHPVVNVTWHDAAEYCKATQVSSGQGRLPTSDEWEAVARGLGRRVYPWGDDWDSSRVHGTGGVGTGTHSVGTLPQGNTPTGVSDLAGNVWEWTSTVDPKGLVLKGGSYLESNPANLRSAVRRTDDRVSAFPDTGFRCAYDSNAW